jgi:hypothetical protein
VYLAPHQSYEQGYRDADVGGNIPSYLDISGKSKVPTNANVTVIYHQSALSHARGLLFASDEIQIQIKLHMCVTLLGLFRGFRGDSLIANKRLKAPNQGLLRLLRPRKETLQVLILPKVPYHMQCLPKTPYCNTYCAGACRCLPRVPANSCLITRMSGQKCSVRCIQYLPPRCLLLALDRVKTGVIRLPLSSPGYCVCTLTDTNTNR